MSDTNTSGTGAPAPASWPPPHPVIDAPYGPRWQPPPEPPEPGWIRGPLEPTPRSKRWVAVFVTVSLLVAGIGGLLVASFIARNTDDTPNGWDTRVAPLAAFVEQATGKTFARPIPVRFLRDAAFEATVTRSATSLSEEERREIAEEEATGRALGWYSGDTRLLDESNEMNAAGILAYYQPGDEVIVARADDPAGALPVDLRVTIVHELVHTMQDQRLGGIDAIRSRADEPYESEAVNAMIEGHAVFVEEAYVDSLSAAERQEYYDRYAATGEEIDERAGDAPLLLSVPSLAPYAFGPVLVGAADRSPTGIAGLYERPPTAMDQALDPRRYVTVDPVETLADPVPPVEPQAPGTWLTMGPVRLYLTLASALEPHDAWAVAAGWGFDEYVSYRRPVGQGGQACVRWVVTGDDTAASRRITTALQTWATARVTAAGVTVQPDVPAAGQVTVDTCDPGTSTTQSLVEDVAADYFYLRANYYRGLIERAGDLTTAGCAWDRLFAEATTTELSNGGDTVLALADRLIGECR